MAQQHFILRLDLKDQPLEEMNLFIGKLRNLVRECFGKEVRMRWDYSNLEGEEDEAAD